VALSQNVPCGVSTRPFDSAQGPYEVPERSRRTGSRSLPDTFFDSAKIHSLQINDPIINLQAFMISDRRGWGGAPALSIPVKLPNRG